MKKLVMILLVLMGVCQAAETDFTLHSEAAKNFSQSLKVINVCHLTENDLNEVMQGHHPEVTIEFLGQTTLPIRFFLKGDLINLVEKKENFTMLEIKQTFYARCVEQELVLSTNLIDWKPFLEFITGQASVVLSIQHENPSITVGAEVNQR